MCVSFSFATAKMSPGPAAATSTCLSPCSASSLPTRRRSPVEALSTLLSGWSVPETTRSTDRVPVYRSITVFMTMAEKTPPGSGVTLVALSSARLVAGHSPRSTGEGSSSSRSRRSRSTPISLVADPHSTGRISPALAPWTSPLRSSSSPSSPSSR